MRVRRDPVYVRRRRIAAAGAVALAVTLGLTACLVQGDEEPRAGAVAGGPDEPQAAEDPAQPEQEDADADAAPPEEDGDGGDAPVEEEPAVPSAQTRMERVDYLTGGLTPKSVVASGHGLVIANNMMYSHTSTVFDAESREQVQVLSDAVDLAGFGIDGHPGTSQGSPVEAAWTEDGRYAYVSQYTMYGENFGREGFDDCAPDSGVGASYLYRFDAEEMAWDQAIKVGAVPKYVDITPDQTRVLVSNWCDSTLSVVDRESASEVAVIPIAAAPRGIEVLPDNRTAYVAAMYADKLFKVDLVEGTSELVMDTPRKPRHLNLSPDGQWLYLAVSGADTVFKIDTATDEIVDQVESGREPRSMILSPDGTALYVVNYYEPSVAKISTEDMELLQKEPTDANPIGVTYEPVTDTVWVACYGGSIYVFDDTVEPSPEG